MWFTARPQPIQRYVDLSATQDGHHRIGDTTRTARGRVRPVPRARWVFDSRETGEAIIGRSR